MLRLKVIIASTRPGRVGPSVAIWFERIARANGRFDVMARVTVALSPMRAATAGAG